MKRLKKPLYWSEVKPKGEWFADACMIIAIVLLIVLLWYRHTEAHATPEVRNMSCGSVLGSQLSE